MTNELLKLRQAVKQEKPLIHCITNHITANDCANIILAAGAVPIMAEHPKEVAVITRTANALAVNLGGISDIKMEAMLISGETAKQHGIPSVIDLVGVGCSTLRLDFAKSFISLCRPNVIKGNASEIKAICGIESSANGIDVGSGDIVNVSNMQDVATMMRELSSRTNAVVVVTGAIDIIVCGKDIYIIKNGCEMLSSISGTGCMLNVLIASFISSGHIALGSVLAAALMGICGELSENEKGIGTFKTALFDNMYVVDDDTLAAKIKLRKEVV